MNTIMSKFSQQFKDISELTQYKVITLNKASGLTNRTEVESDHIRIYKITNYSSFAFAFHNTTTNAPYIMATIKFNENISSAKYSPLTLKEKLKEYINVLKVLKATQQLNEKSSFASFDTLFIKPKMEESLLEANSLEDKLFKHIEESTKNYQTDIKQNQKLINEINIAEKELKTKYAQKIVELGIPELKKQLQEKELIAKSYQHSEQLKLNLDNKKAEQRALERSLKLIRNTLQQDMENILSSLPKTYTKKIREKFSKKISELLLSIDS